MIVIKRAKKQTKQKYKDSIAVTGIALLNNVPPVDLEQLTDIANRCGQLRSDIWNKFGSVSGWGLNRDAYSKHQMQVSLREIFPVEKYGLSAKLYERTAYKCLDEIATYQDAIKSYVIDEIYRRYSNETERKYLVMMLNTQAWLYVNSTRARWLHPTIRSVLLGTRSGDQFHCFDKVVLQADYNAARNILARGYDAEITRYMKFTDVKLILLRRTEQFNEQRLRDRAKTLEGYEGVQLSLFDITSSHSESAV